MSNNEGPTDPERAATVTVTEEGITIEKRLTLDQFDTPAIVFRLRSDRDDPAYVRVTDPLPEAVDPSDVGLHPEYDSEGWRRRGRDLRFEGRLDPDAQIETVYGLRVENAEPAAEYLVEPTVDRVVETDAAGNEDAKTSNDNEAASNETDQGRTDDDESTQTSPSSSPSSSSPGVTGADEESVAAALARELERGTVDDDTLATLDHHLNPSLSESAQTRVDAVQARLSDLEAYTDALERVLDRVGTDEDVVEGIADLRRSVDRLDGTTDTLESNLAELESEVDEGFGDASASLSELTTQVDGVANEVDKLERRLEPLEGVPEAVSELGDAVEELRSLHEDVRELQEWRTNLTASIAGVDTGDTRGGDDD